MTQTSPRGGIGRLYASLWSHSHGRRWMVVTFLALLLAAQAIRLSIPWFFGRAVDALQASGAQDVRQAALDMAAMFGACVAGWVLHGPGRVIERFTAVAIRERLADTLYAKAVSLPMRWHESHHSGDTIQRMNKAVTALFGFSQHQFVYLQNLVGLIGPLAAICAISWLTGGAALAGYGVIALLLVRFDRVMVVLIGEENKAERRWQAELVDCLGNIGTVLSLRLQAATRASIARRMQAVSEPFRRGIVVNEAKWCIIDLLNNGICTGLVVLYAGLSWRQGGMVLLGTTVMVHQYAQQIGSVVSSMAGHWGDLVRHQADIGSADEILNAPVRPLAAMEVGLEDWSTIAIDGLCFRHTQARGDAPTLNEVALTLRRGGRVALVGESGSGKSTLLRVLAGLYQADRVAIGVDGAARPDLTDLAAIATLVPQDPEVFESTIRRNLTLGLDYSEAAVARACRLACLDPVIAALPLGLDTDISERGVNLSGGQKQRLALARGLLASATSSLVLLDEPTSSLDATTEAAITANLLDELSGSCIVSSVHRLHLLPHFDTVVLMADGKVVDAGPLEHLLARQLRFRALWARSRAETAGAA
jgi:ABC-type multidrug transport system fused ATPase/permease subunit